MEELKQILEVDTQPTSSQTRQSIDQVKLVIAQIRMEEKNQETKYRKDTIEEQNLIIDKAIQLRSKYREQLKVKQHQ